MNFICNKRYFSDKNKVSKYRVSRYTIWGPRNAIFGINITGLSFLTLEARFSAGGRRLLLHTDLEGLCFNLFKAEDSLEPQKALIN